MSEVSRGSGGGAFAKVVQKTLARTRTKVLQRVGKAEKTTDEVFKDNIIAFQRQQATALRLQKEMKHYLSCVRAMSSAAKSLYAVLKDTYEEDWYDPHSFNSSLNSLELMNTNYEAEISERVYADLTEYIEQFPVYKDKMNKRNRKRLDYDNAKHAYETLYAAKKPDHTKISKAHESLLDTKALFEEINNELHKELPRFYDYRVELLSTNLMRLCNAEATYHTNTGKVNDQLVELLQTLANSHAEEMERLANTSLKEANISHEGAGEGLDLSSLSPDAHTPVKTNGHGGDGPSPRLSNHRNNSSQKVSEEPESRRAPPPARPSAAPQSPSIAPPPPPTDNGAPAEDDPAAEPAADLTGSGNPFITSDEEIDEPVDSKTSDNTQVSENKETGGNPFEDEDVVEEEKPSEPEDTSQSSEPTVASEPMVIVMSSSVTPRSDSKPSSSGSSASTVLYQVMATHPYTAEDEDELSFDAGEIINVVEYDGEDEQDDGWLMGINCNTSDKGVFPANFTQKIARKT